MELIKLDDDRFLVKDSCGKILSKKEVAIVDIESNKCVKGLYKGINKNDVQSNNIEETESTNKPNNESECN